MNRVSIEQHMRMCMCVSWTVDATQTYRRIRRRVAHLHQRRDRVLVGGDPAGVLGHDGRVHGGGHLTCVWC